MKYIIFFILLILNIIQAETKTIAIYDFGLENIEFKNYLQFRKDFYKILSKKSDYNVMAEPIMRTILSNFSNSSDCFSDNCVIDAVKNLGVDYAISGTIHKNGNKLDINFILIDVLAAKKINSFKSVYNANLNFVSKTQLNNIIANLLKLKRQETLKPVKKIEPVIKKVISEKSKRSFQFMQKYYNLKPKDIRNIVLVPNSYKNKLSFEVANQSVALISDDWRILALTPGKTSVYIKDNKTSNIVDTLIILVNEEKTEQKQIDSPKIETTKKIEPTKEIDKEPTKRVVSENRNYQKKPIYNNYPSKNAKVSNEKKVKKIRAKARLYTGMLAQYYGPTVAIGGSFGFQKNDSKIYFGLDLNAGSSVTYFYYSKNIHAGFGIDFLYALKDVDSYRLNAGLQLGYYYFQNKYYNEERTDYTLNKFDYIGGPQLEYMKKMKNNNSIFINVSAIAGASQDRQSISDAFNKLSLSIFCKLGYSFNINN